MDHIHAALPVADAAGSAVDTADGESADVQQTPYAENSQDEMDAADDVPQMAPSAAKDAKAEEDGGWDAPESAL